LQFSSQFRLFSQAAGTGVGNGDHCFPPCRLEVMSSESGQKKSEAFDRLFDEPLLLVGVAPLLLFDGKLSRSSVRESSSLAGVLGPVDTVGVLGVAAEPI